MDPYCQALGCCYSPGDPWEGLELPYSTIVADPPWPLRKRPNESIYGSKKYSTMSLEDITAMPVADLAAKDAHLWLWVTNTYLPDAGPIVRAWGFEVTTIVTWCKPGPGVGSYVRNNTEHLIFATRGKAMTPEDKPLSSWYQWPRGRHSVKPAAALDLIEQVSPGPYVELFARAPRLGWDSWGMGYETGEVNGRVG